MSTRLSILLAATASLALAQGASASAVTISFSTPSIDLTGGAVTENITLSGLTGAGQELTGYNLAIDFNAGLLAASNLVINPLPDDIGGGPTTIDNTAGVVAFSDFGVGPDGDFSTEGDSFMLASITFTPLGGGTGTSSPSFDFSGSQFLGLTDPSCLGSAPPEPQCPFPVLLKVTTSGGGTVPEPSTLALFGLGALGLGLAVIRRRRGTA